MHTAYHLSATLQGRWESKGTYVFYLELVTDLLHLFVYCVFFFIVFTHYGLPLHLMRDLYATFRNFRNRITDFLRFRRVTARMDRFPDATAEDLERCDGICIICREEMSMNGECLDCAGDACTVLMLIGAVQRGSRKSLARLVLRWHGCSDVSPTSESVHVLCYAMCPSKQEADRVGSRSMHRVECTPH